MNPIAPVAQKAHCSAQPTCDEMQSVSPLAVGNRDGFDRLAVVQAKQEFLGAVRGALPCDDLEARQIELRREQLAQRRRQLGHRVERPDAGFSQRRRTTWLARYDG